MAYIEGAGVSIPELVRIVPPRTAVDRALANESCKDLEFVSGEGSGSLVVTLSHQQLHELADKIRREVPRAPLRKVLVSIPGARKTYTFGIRRTVAVGDTITVPGPPWAPDADQEATVTSLDSDYTGTLREAW